jgi:16S rRNA (cytosine967-C5)-methyltransferase
MKAMDARKIAWSALIEFQKNGRNPDEVLSRLIGKNYDERDRALAWEITLGTIRYLKRLDFIAQAYIKAPISKQKPKILAALRIGLYQLTETSGVPPFAAVDETVRLISESDMKRDAGFINAVLRAYLREPSKVVYPDAMEHPEDYLAAFYSYPDWLVKRWHKRYGYEETMMMLMAGNKRQRMAFKVMSRLGRDMALEQLQQEEIEVTAGKYLPDFISSEEGHFIIESDLFKGGGLTVQDESQGIATGLLPVGPGDIVLDLCSAPGGKTIALADKVGSDGKVISLDKDAKRLKNVQENAERVGLGNIEYVSEDVLKYDPGRKFKYILLDVPCSGLGTLSANVDLRWIKMEKDIKAFSKIQRAMLEKAGSLLHDKGFLVYSTCTTEPDEIENVIADFLKSHGDFYLENSRNPLLNQFRTETGTYHAWPHKHGIGGGGFALLRKKNEA